MRIFIMMGFVFLSACASSAPAPEATAGSTPDWVVHPQALYPETRYLVAVGSGKNRNEAIQDAKKNLAESFMVKVQSETTSHRQSSLSENTAGSVSGSSDQDTHHELTLTTDAYLRGAEVKEVSEGKETFALVALDKLKARSGLLLEAQKSQAKLDSLYDSLKEQYSHDKREAALTELNKFDGLYSEASALGMGALVNINDYVRKFDQLDQANRNKMKKVIFTVKMKSGKEYFRNDLEACIVDRGGTVYSGEKAPEQANKIEVDVVERPQHYEVQGWTKMRFDLTASVTQPDGKLFRVQTSKVETGRSKDAVMEAAADDLSKEFCDKMFNRIGEM